MFKDPFGYAGPENLRPYQQCLLMDTRSQLDAQERAISMHSRLDHLTADYTKQRCPPTDHTRSRPELFAAWMRRTDEWEAMEREDVELYKEETAFFSKGWQADGNGLFTSRAHVAPRNRMAYRWWDESTGGLLCCSYDGKPGVVVI